MTIEKVIVTQDYVNEISYKIVACAIEVHKTIGPGLLESIYHACLLEELEQKGLFVKKGTAIDATLLQSTTHPLSAMSITGTNPKRADRHRCHHHTQSRQKSFWIQRANWNGYRKQTHSQTRLHQRITT